MQSNVDFIQGSASELVKAGTFVNGQKIDAVGISVLARYGIIQTVGKAEKVQGKRGKVGNIYRIPSVLLKTQAQPCSDFQYFFNFQKTLKGVNYVQDVYFQRILPANYRWGKP